MPAGKTTALDTESERQIQQALETLMKGRTTIVIVHRLSTVVNADVIHAMDQGRLVQSGSHAELLAEGGRYAKLHALQFEAAKEFAEEPAALPRKVARESARPVAGPRALCLEAAAFRSAGHRTLAR